MAYILCSILQLLEGEKEREEGSKGKGKKVVYRHKFKTRVNSQNRASHTILPCLILCEASSFLFFLRNVITIYSTKSHHHQTINIKKIRHSFFHI